MQEKETVLNEHEKEITDETVTAQADHPECQETSDDMDSGQDEHQADNEFEVSAQAPAAQTFSAEEIADRIRPAMKKEIENYGFIQNSKLGIILKNGGINYKDYASDMDTFMEMLFPHTYAVKKNVSAGEKTLPKILVPIENAEQYHETKPVQITAVLDTDTVERLKKKLIEKGSVDGYLSPDMITEILKDTHIDYRTYAKKQRTFIERYFSDVLIPENDVEMDGKIFPIIYMLAEKSEEPGIFDVDTAKKVKEKLTEEIKKRGFLLASVIPEILNGSFHIDYRNYAKNLNAFIEKVYPGQFIWKKDVLINGKQYPSIFILRESAGMPINLDMDGQIKQTVPSGDETFNKAENGGNPASDIHILDEDLKEKVKTALSESISGNGFIPVPNIPAILNNIGLANFKQYAATFSQFISLYFSDVFMIKKNIVIDGEVYSIILTSKDHPVSGIDLVNNQNISLSSFAGLYENREYEAILTGIGTLKPAPQNLGFSGLETALKAIAGFLGEDPESIHLNDFHRLLIETERVPDLKPYKDDEHILKYGAGTAIIPMDVEKFKQVFSTLHNGKQNYNHTWKGIVERFWAIQSEYAVYFSCLWLIVAKNEKCIDEYIKEAKRISIIGQMPMVLKINQAFGCSNVTPRLQIKIISTCLEHNNVETLISCCRLFGNTMIPEAAELADYLSDNAYADGDKIISWFHSDLKAQLSEKIANYFWWKQSADGVSADMIKILSSVYWEFPENYYTEIIYNPSIPSFGRKEKEKLLKDGFKEICASVRTCKKTYTWANYLYLTYRDDENSEEYDEIWSQLRMWMMEQVMAQLNDDFRSAQLLSNFRLDPEARQELEEFYCENYVEKVTNGFVEEDELDNYVETCENQGLQFITQWVLKNKKGSDLSYSEANMHSLCMARNFGEALQYIRNSKLDHESKIKQVSYVLCENFKAYNISPKAFEIFDYAITMDAAESALRNKLSLADHDEIAALIAIYYYRKEWLKVAYLMAPFKKNYLDKHRKLIEDVSLQMSKEYRIDLSRCEKSHFDAVKNAMKICSNDEFDNFIEWTGIIKVNSDTNSYKPFEKQIDSLLDGLSKDEFWKQLLWVALRTDNNEERLDNIRFCIIAGFLGRYGINAVESQIRSLLSHYNGQKRYPDYYEGLWKGLLNGKYTVNFLRLCKDIIPCAPLTFWNVFYDVAVKKNHVFSTDEFELNTWRNDQQNYQEFYSAILKQYKETRDVIYLKIAVAVLTDCAAVLEPDFGQYISFISSGRSKAFLLAGIASMIRQNRYMDEITDLLNSEYWVLSRKEHDVLRLLKYCAIDDELEGTEYENLPETDLSQFRKDCLYCIRNYPELDFDYAMRISENSNSRLRLFAQLIRIEYSPLIKPVIEKAPKINEDWKADSAVADYFRLAAAFYQKQSSENNANSDSLYAMNRYIRMFAAQLLTEEKFEDYSDDNVIALMKENRHFSAIYTDYEALKKRIYEFISLESEPEILKVIYLTGLISGDYEQLIDCAPQYSTQLLETICTIEKNTNYRNLNMQLLSRFVITLDTEFDENDILYVKSCSPTVYRILCDIRKIRRNHPDAYPDVKSLLNGICRLHAQDKARYSYNAMRTALEKKRDLLKENWDMYMDALLCASYRRTIIGNLLTDIKERKISTSSLRLWSDVFRSMNENDTFNYLLSAHYALANKRADARETYAMISEVDNLPKAWTEDIRNLKRYITLENDKFNLVGDKQLRNLAIEKDADSVSFIQANSRKEEVSLDIAVNAYRTITGMDTPDTEKLAAYRQLLSFVHNPDDLFAVYSRIEKNSQNEKSGRRTYNELIIEYGSLLITLETELSADHKLEILLEIYDVYGFLNDINKAKEDILERMNLAEEKVLETPGVSFDRWIENHEKIMDIVRHPSAHAKDETVNEFASILSACVRIAGSSTSEMELLAKLESWRKAWNLQQNASNFEYALVRSVDEKIRLLKEGVNLSVNIINHEIENNCIFYEVHNNTETSNTTIILDNKNHPSSATLEALVSVNGNDPVAYEGAQFTNSVELRPGDYCGQYYRLHGNAISSLRSGDSVSLRLNVIVDHKIICSCSQKLSFSYSTELSLKEKRTSENRKYETGAPAFGENVKGFGRETEKREIREYLSRQLVVIYGPSRVGKSSLLNYIRNDYAKEFSDVEKKSVLTIGIADDNNSDDYSKNMLDENLEVSFDDTRSVLRYLFIAPLKIAFSSEPEMRIKSRMRCRYKRERFSDTMRNEINDVISSGAGVRDILAVISQILYENNAEIWYLFDEFQQIIEKWKGDTKEFTDLCNDIMFHQKSIRLVLCGSDDLVRLYECENDMRWNAFVSKTADNGVQVGQLSTDDFKAMMHDNVIWKSDSGDAWTLEALELLYSYTGGIAIFGKLFGNELLDQIKNDEFEGRRKLYPSDITKVAYELLSSATGKIKNLIKINTEKNLDAEKPYLWFIAYELMQDQNNADISIRRIREFFSGKSLSEVDNALKICIARGILKKNETKQRYGFSTMFYFDFFRSQVNEAKIQELSILMKSADDLDGKTEADPLNLKFIREYFDEADPKVQNEFLAGLAINAKDQKALRGLIGNTQTGTIFNSEATFNQYNIQSITNTLNGIMTASDPQLLLQGIQKLPRLDNYLPMIETDGVQEPLSEERISRAMDNYVADMEESLETSCKETHDTAIDVPYSEILRISDDEWDEFMEKYNLPEFFLRSLKFAYRLEQLFRKGALGNDDNEIDYSPVTIMYSKLIESLLKEYHIGIYGESFKEQDTEMSRPGNRRLKYKWKEIGSLAAAQKQKLTIGSFVFPLNKSGGVDKIASVSGKDRNLWNAHKKMINAVKDIRNPSAHGNKDDRISLEQKENLSDMLFKNGGFLRLIRLAHD